MHVAAHAVEAQAIRKTHMLLYLLIVLSSTAVKLRCHGNSVENIKVAWVADKCVSCAYAKVEELQVEVNGLNSFC